MLLVPGSLHVFIFKKRFMQCRIFWLCLGKQIKWNLISPQSCSTPTPKILLLLPEGVWCGPSSVSTSLTRSPRLLPRDGVLLLSLKPQASESGPCADHRVLCFELCTSKRSRVGINATGSYSHFFSRRHCGIRAGTATWA